MDLNKDFVVKLTGLAIVTVDAEGKSHVNPAEDRRGVGGLWGFVGNADRPVVLRSRRRLLLGGAMGALFGKLGKTGINDQFRSQVQDLLKPGSSAVVIMADKVNRGQVRRRDEAVRRPGAQDLAV